MIALLLITLEKKKLKTHLSGVDRVNITTDMCTSFQRVSYMVATCHFVDSNWLLQKMILNFCNVRVNIQVLLLLMP